jgi:hypothetical protein
MIEYSTLKVALGLFSGANLIFGPRLGPLRALSIAIKSKYGPAVLHPSLHHDLVSRVKNNLRRSQGGHRYAALTGPKGIGKSLVIQTALQRTAGVLAVTAAPGDNSTTIVNNALDRIVDHKLKLLPNHSAAIRIIFWHRVFTFGYSPIILICATERGSVTAPYAEIAAASRRLRDEYKLRLVIDGSPHALEESVLHTKREDIFEVPPMTREMIWLIPQFKELFEIMDSDMELQEITFSVLGGIPINYDALLSALLDHLNIPHSRKPFRFIMKALSLLKSEIPEADKPKAVAFIKDYLCTMIHDASLAITEFERISTPAVKDILKKFDSKTSFVEVDPSILPTNKILRATKFGDSAGVTSCSSAIGLALSLKLDKKPKWKDLQSAIIARD